MFARQADNLSEIVGILYRIKKDPRNKKQVWRLQKYMDQLNTITGLLIAWEENDLVIPDNALENANENRKKKDLG